MGAIALIFLTFFAATICGSVFLIQIGGWLPILAAILIILEFFLYTGLIIILLAAEMNRKKKTQVEEAMAEFADALRDRQKRKEEEEK